MSNNCANCKFCKVVKKLGWLGISEKIIYECHLEAPKIYLNWLSQPRTCFPIIKADDWCMHFLTGK